MGNAQNTGEKKETKSLTSIIDFIATDYILTQNFTDMYNSEVYRSESRSVNKSFDLLMFFPEFIF